MKPFCLAAISLLLFAFYSSTVAQSLNQPDKCCFSFFKSRIPPKNVERFETTKPDCKYPAVIFHTTKQLEICADPSEKWVQRLMGIVKNRMPEVTAGNNRMLVMCSQV